MHTVIVATCLCRALSTATSLFALTLFAFLAFLLLLQLLRQDLFGVEFNQQAAIIFQLFDGYEKFKVIQQEELEFEMIEFVKRQSADLLTISVPLGAPSSMHSP